MGNPYVQIREVCPVCQNPKGQTLFSCRFTEPPIRDYLINFYSRQGKIELEYLEDATYTLVVCCACYTVYQKEIPNDFLMGKLYEEWIDPECAFTSYLPQEKLRYSVRYMSEVMSIIAFLGISPRKLNFLDFGMGWGHWCLVSQALGCNTFGLEISPSRIDYARSRGVKVIEWKEMCEAQFDFINTEQVFEHIAYPLETLQQLGKFLKPRGLIKISVPNGRSIHRRLRIGDWQAVKGTKNSLNLVSPLEHINCFNRNAIIKMAQLAGLCEIRIPLKLQYAYTSGWSDAKQAAFNLAWPVYKNILRQGTYLFFTPYV